MGSTIEVHARIQAWLRANGGMTLMYRGSLKTGDKREIAMAKRHVIRGMQRDGVLSARTRTCDVNLHEHLRVAHLIR